MYLNFFYRDTQANFVTLQSIWKIAWYLTFSNERRRIIKNKQDPILMLNCSRQYTCTLHSIYRVYHKFVQIKIFIIKKVMLGKNFGVHEYDRRDVRFFFQYVKKKKNISKVPKKRAPTRHTQTFYAYKASNKIPGRK